MADRWSNPSGSVGVHRFRVWPSGTDSYDHVELAANWDKLDAMIGEPPSGDWPPSEGVNGGIYALIKALQDEDTNLQSQITGLVVPSPVTVATTVAGLGARTANKVGVVKL